MLGAFITYLFIKHLYNSIQYLYNSNIKYHMLGNFNVHNPDWLTHSSHFTSPVGRDVEEFAIVSDLPPSIPDSSGDKANAHDLFPTSNLDIYSNPTVILLLVTLITDYQDRSFSSQRVFYCNKADWDSPRTFLAEYSWCSGFSYDPSGFATFITCAIQIDMGLFTPSF